MDRWDKTTIQRAVYFGNDAGKNGVSAIEARIAGTGNYEIRIARAEYVPESNWRELMPRIEAKMRAKIGSDMETYTAAGTVPLHDVSEFNGNHFIIKGIPLDHLDASLAAVLGGLSSNVDTRDGVGINKPLLDNVATTKAIKDLQLGEFVADLKARGFVGTPG